MKFTADESRFLEALKSAGGSYVPHVDHPPNREAVRIIRRLERKGAIAIEQVDTGFRYTIKAGV